MEFFSLFVRNLNNGIFSIDSLDCSQFFFTISCTTLRNRMFEMQKKVQADTARTVADRGAAKMRARSPKKFPRLRIFTSSSFFFFYFSLISTSPDLIMKNRDAISPFLKMVVFSSHSQASKWLTIFYRQLLPSLYSRLCFAMVSDIIQISGWVFSRASLLTCSFCSWVLVLSLYRPLLEFLLTRQAV